MDVLSFQVIREFWPLRREEGTAWFGALQLATGWEDFV